MQRFTHIRHFLFLVALTLPRKKPLLYVGETLLKDFDCD
jgi:hypothetical protein